MKLTSMIILVCFSLLNNAWGATIPTISEDEYLTSELTTLAEVEAEMTEATEVVAETDADEQPPTQTPEEVIMISEEPAETTTQDLVQQTDQEDTVTTLTSSQFTADQIKLIEAIARNLNAQNYQPIEAYVELNHPSFTNLIPAIIKTAYHNARTNVSNILWITDHLKSAEHKVRVFENLWSEMQENVDHTQTIMLACYLHLQMCECNTDDINAINRYEHLKDQLPAVVQKMFWNKVCLRNQQFKEYLYTDEEQFDSDRRVAFTWKPKPKYMHVIDQNHWNILENQRCQSLLLANEQNEFLYAASDGFTAGKQKRRVFTWVRGDVVKQSGWQLEPVTSDGPLVFRLRNLHYNEYLYADKSYEVFDSKRRSVYTGAQAMVGGQDKWEIGDC